MKSQSKTKEQTQMSFELPEFTLSQSTSQVIYKRCQTALVVLAIGIVANLVALARGGQQRLGHALALQVLTEASLVLRQGKRQATKNRREKQEVLLQTRKQGTTIRK